MTKYSSLVLSLIVYLYCVQPSSAQDAFCGSWWTTSTTSSVSANNQHENSSAFSAGAFPSFSSASSSNGVSVTQSPSSTIDARSVTSLPPVKEVPLRPFTYGPQVVRDRWSQGALDFDMASLIFNGLLIGVPSLFLIYLTKQWPFDSQGKVSNFP